jgi:hypothetical protein
MRKLRVVQDGHDSSGLTGSLLFSILWDELVDLLGPSAASALLRRALRRALPHCHDLAGLTIERVDEHYGYAVPASFSQPGGRSPALRALMEELHPLLTELTGEVALRHLEQVPELRRWAREAPRA